MTPSVTVVLVCGYALLLLGLAWALDLAGARSAARSASWRTGNFVYHDDQDAWKCHQDEWLYPASFDPEKRVIRYQGQHAICGRCPVKDTCSPTPGPREVTRAIDPWPHSEAGRFHRGLSLCVAVIAVMMPTAMLVAARSSADVICLLAVIGTGVCLGWPLARHLWNSPSNFPEHLPQDASAPALVPGMPDADGPAEPARWRSLPIVQTTTGAREGDLDQAVARANELIDRYSTRWSGDARSTGVQHDAP